MVPPHFAGVLQQPASSGTWDRTFSPAVMAKSARQARSMPLFCNGNVPSQPTGTAHIRHCRRYVQKSVWCAAHGMYSPFPLADFHLPSALCAGTETVVLLPGLRIYCSIAYFFVAVKGFWREKTLFHDFRRIQRRKWCFLGKLQIRSCFSDDSPI